MIDTFESPCFIIFLTSLYSINWCVCVKYFVHTQNWWWYTRTHIPTSFSILTKNISICLKWNEWMNEKGIFLFSLISLPPSSYVYKFRIFSFDYFITKAEQQQPGCWKNLSLCFFIWFAKKFIFFNFKFFTFFIILPWKQKPKNFFYPEK